MSTLSLLTWRDPFAELDALVRDAFGRVTAQPQTRPAGFVPAAEITREGSDVVVRVELPGVDVAKDVAVEVDRGRLVVRGERHDGRSQDHNGHTLREVRYGSFRRAFALPQHVAAEAVTASYDAGVLSVRVAGAYTGTEARQIAITTGTPAAEPGEQPAA